MTQLLTMTTTHKFPRQTNEDEEKDNDQSEDETTGGERGAYVWGKGKKKKEDLNNGMEMKKVNKRGRK